MKNIFIICLLIVGLTLWQLRNWVYEPKIVTEETSVIITKGCGSACVARQLVDAQIINKPWLFKLAARFFGADKKLKAGEYLFNQPISMYDVIKKISDGDVVYHKITLAEGLTTKQIIDLINNEPMLSGDISIDIAEGEILPETYSFVRGESKNSLLTRAKAAMSEFLQRQWDSRQLSLPLKNKKQLLILASIIEKETAVNDERGLVASVFVNRLTKGIKLQTDPTVIYSITMGQKDLGRQLTRKDLAFDSPYNTYKYYGLPPAPICNPGKASIEAAANPIDSDYLYFVADGNGGHNFAKSLKKHNQNVQRWKNAKK